MPEDTKAIQIQDQLSDANGRIRDTKIPFITALEDEDTPEDLEVFGVRDFFPNDCIFIANSDIGSGVTISLKLLEMKFSREQRC